MPPPELPAEGPPSGRAWDWVVVTLEPDPAHLVGACMLGLSLAPSGCGTVARVVDGDRPEHAAFVRRAEGLGWRVVPTPRHPANPFLNKWLGWEALRDLAGTRALLDWDCLRTGDGALPGVAPGRIAARRNPAGLYDDLRPVAEPLSPALWEAEGLRSSVNGGVVLGGAAEVAALAARVLDLAGQLAAVRPEAPAWKVEQLAVSLAAGELGLDPLDDGWNVTPTSPVSDDRVELWHYNDGHALTRSLKRSLAVPAAARRWILRLGEAWPRQARQMLRWHAQACDRLGLGAPGGPVGEEAERLAPARAPGPHHLVVAASSGLCNRLLLLAGAMRVAELTGRRLVLHWTRNSELGAGFEDLFCNDLARYSPEFGDYLLASHLPVKVYNAWKMDPPYFTDLAPDGDPTAAVVIVKGWMYPKFSHEFYDDEFFAANRPYLQSLVPRPELAARADAFPLPAGCLGVHLRRGDAEPEFARSSDDHFRILMESVLEAEPATRFLVATDDPSTEQKFRGLFGDRVLAYPKTRAPRGSVEGGREALVDLLLLSRTRAILGNHFSSFSHAAAALRGIPLVRATAQTSGPDRERSVGILRGFGTASPGVADAAGRVRVYTLHTPSHRPLFDHWFRPSCPSDVDLRAVAFENPGPGEIHDPSFWRAIVRKVEVILEAIEENWGGSFVWCDVDAQFFGSFAAWVPRVLARCDLAFQIDAPGPALCTGLFFCRANEATRALWREALDYLRVEDHARDEQILVRERAFRMPGLRTAFLPPEFAGGGTLTGRRWRPGEEVPVSEGVLIHHANFCVGVPDKVAQCRQVREQVRAGRLVSRAEARRRVGAGALLAGGQGAGGP